MTDVDHGEFANAVSKCSGKVAVSGYRCELMDGLFRDWRRVESAPKVCHSIKKTRREALWMNY